MKLEEVIATLNSFAKTNPTAEVLASCDEELNVLFKKFEIVWLDEDEKTIIICPLSGSETREG